MSQVFADAFYFIARLNRRDQYHDKTLKLVLGPHVHLITTEWILVEVADGLANSEVRPRIQDMFHTIHATPVL